MEIVTNMINFFIIEKPRALSIALSISSIQLISKLIEHSWEIYLTHLFFLSPDPDMRIACCPCGGGDSRLCTLSLLGVDNIISLLFDLSGDFPV